MHARNYPLHDGQLTLIAVADKQVMLGLRQTDGTALTMTLTGVEALNVNGFRLGNTILWLRAIPEDGRGADRNDRPGDDMLAGLDMPAVMEALFPGPHPSASPDIHAAHAAFIAAKLKRLSTGEATLVVLAPSYGAALSAYCLTVDLRADCQA